MSEQNEKKRDKNSELILLMYLVVSLKSRFSVLFHTCLSSSSIHSSLGNSLSSETEVNGEKKNQQKTKLTSTWNSSTFFQEYASHNIALKFVLDVICYLLSVTLRCKLNCIRCGCQNWNIYIIFIASVRVFRNKEKETLISPDSYPPVVAASIHQHPHPRHSHTRIDKQTNQLPAAFVASGMEVKRVVRKRRTNIGKYTNRVDLKVLQLQFQFFVKILRYFRFFKIIFGRPVVIPSSPSLSLSHKSIQKKIHLSVGKYSSRHFLSAKGCWRQNRHVDSVCECSLLSLSTNRHTGRL